MEHNFTWKNDGRTKVMIGCGTRPEIIRLAAVIKRCREYFDCCVVYYNQNWDRNLSTVFWEDFELKNTFGEYGPDILVPVVGENLGVTCGNILGRSYELLSELQPEGYLVLGDTNSCLSAISAKRLHIPLFHMEAGNRCKDECLPEETNRRIVDVISDVNMCYSEFARKYLADTGLPKERTYQTGSPMAEVLHMNLEKIQKSDVLERLGLEKDKYILLSAHREENIDSEKNFLSLFTAINALAEKYDMPILYSCHPRSKHRLEKSGFQLDPRVRVNEPLGFNDYNKLQMNALAIVSDSGTLPEESSFYLSIGHPIAAVCIRTSTERPEALEAGDFILAGITTRELLNATDMAIEMKQKGVLGKPCPDYVDETVSMKVVRIIQGYVNVVNKMVWRIINSIFEQYHPDIVVNLGAQAGVRYSITNPDAYIESNMIGFYNILEACRHYPVEHLVYASSSSVYGSNKKVPYSTDDKVDNPVSLYAATKKSNELMAHAYSKLYNIPSTGLRFFTVYGPAGRPDMAYFGFTNKLVKGKTIQIFNYGNCKRDFTYVDDIVEGVVRVMAKAPEKKNGEDGLPIPPYAVYNIGNSNPENLLDFVQILSEELVRAGVLPADYDFEAHKELVPMQPGDVPVTFADTEPLERDFGFKPHTPLREGLRKFAEWYKEFYME